MIKRGSRGMAGRGEALHVEAWRGKAVMARLGLARQGSQGGARRDKYWRGEARQGSHGKLR